MPKINQEEYEVLKKIRKNGFEEIRRNSTGDIAVRVIGEEVTSHQYHAEHNDKFKFLETTGDYWSIAELIEEYDRESRIKQVLGFYEEGFRNVREAFTKLSKAFSEESEETEVKKNIEWAKNQIDLRDTGTTDMAAPQFYVNVGLRLALDFLNQLDEPEVLSQEWIDENKVARINNLRKMTTSDVVTVEKLKNLLVPKQEEENSELYGKFVEIVQMSPVSAHELLDTLANLVAKQHAYGTEKQAEVTEKHGMSESEWAEVIDRYKWHLEQEDYVVIEKPTIPQFVADWIEKNHSFGSNLNHDIFNLITDAYDTDADERKLIENYLYDNSDAIETIVDAYRYGHTVEEE